VAAAPQHPGARQAAAGRRRRLTAAGASPTSGGRCPPAAPPRHRRRRQEAGQRRSAAGPSDQAAMQPHAHHPPALRPQQVAGAAQVVLEALGVAEAGRHRELHVVVVERVGDDEVRLAADRHVVRQVVVIGVAVVEEAAMLGDQAPGVGRHAAGVPAHGAAAGQARDGLDAAGDVGALRVLVHLVVVDPAEGVAGHLMALVREGAGGGGVQLQRPAHAIDRQFQVALGKQAKDAPDPCPCAVVELAFHAAVARAQQRRPAGNLVQIGLAAGVAVEHGVLAPLLVVQHEGKGEPRPAGPFRVGRVGAVAQEVAREAGAVVEDMRHGPAEFRAAPFRSSRTFPPP